MKEKIKNIKGNLLLISNDEELMDAASKNKNIDESYILSSINNKEKNKNNCLNPLNSQYLHQFKEKIIRKIEMMQKKINIQININPLLSLMNSLQLIKKRKIVFSLMKENLTML